MLAVTIMHMEFNKGIHSSGIIFIFWIIQVTAGIVPFRSLIIDTDQVRQLSDKCLFHIDMSCDIIFLKRRIFR